jgi:hypothetical protein
LENILNLHEKSENLPNNSTRLFLFNGVPREAFLAYTILWRSGDPVTGCIHDLVFKIGYLKEWGIPVGWSFPGQKEDFISREGK